MGTLDGPAADADGAAAAATEALDPAVEADVAGVDLPEGFPTALDAGIGPIPGIAAVPLGAGGAGAPAEALGGATWAGRVAPASTSTTACIQGCGVQWYLNAPTLAKVKLQLSPALIVEESKDPSYAVTVWNSLPGRFCHVTVVPGGTTRDAGSNPQVFASVGSGWTM